MDPNVSADQLGTSVANSAPAAGLLTEGYEAVIETGIHNMHSVFWCCLQTFLFLGLFRVGAEVCDNSFLFLGLLCIRKILLFNTEMNILSLTSDGAESSPDVCLK